MLSGRDWLNIGSMAMRIVGRRHRIDTQRIQLAPCVSLCGFIMIDYDRLGAGVRRNGAPQFRRRAFLIGRDIKTSMNHYFRGQALVAFCVGVLFCIGFLIMGLPLAVLLGPLYRSAEHGALPPAHLHTHHRGALPDLFG